jgi:hypothetical protein
VDQTSITRTRRAIALEQQRTADEAKALEAVRHELDAEEQEALATRHARERHARQQADAADAPRKGQ